ncbi:hypothetical protein QVD17_38159 [Tagetes erecta]|uniref:Uncharacterized protein n=1 Tax=Tagetes erecta TaxID=13708 RepID=A0AAD8NJ64_TARER|nr:hypothetical protein QVD17_38159 [Tagetes erecta]
MFPFSFSHEPHNNPVTISLPLIYHFSFRLYAFQARTILFFCLKFCVYCLITDLLFNRPLEALLRCNWAFFPVETQGVQTGYKALHQAMVCTGSQTLLISDYPDLSLVGHIALDKPPTVLDQWFAILQAAANSVMLQVFAVRLNLFMVHFFDLRCVVQLLLLSVAANSVMLQGAIIISQPFNTKTKVHLFDLRYLGHIALDKPPTVLDQWFAILQAAAIPVMLQVFAVRLKLADNIGLESSCAARIVVAAAAPTHSWLLQAWQKHEHPYVNSRSLSSLLEHQVDHDLRSMSNL